MTETLVPHRHDGPALEAGLFHQRMVEIGDRVFAYVQPDGGWCVNNAGVLVDRDRAVVIDTAATEGRARMLRDAVDETARVPPRVLVNTHFHGDHTFGNALVAGSDAVIVAHELARTEMAAADLGLTKLWPHVEWGGIEVVLPQLTFHDGLTLHLSDGRRAELLHVGPAHTTNDTVVWLPEERILFAGDVLMSGCTPFVLMGSVAGSLRAMERLRALGPRLVVGGHGAPCGPEVIDETIGYLRRLQDIALEARSAGIPPLEAAREAGAGPYADWLDPERLVGNLHRAAAELDGAVDGAPLDVIRIFGELVEYNGGRLPDCWA
ncbi:MBL fold metallo-hydrolase [Streptacidiphilus jiangxiensis]|uniref:Cyclase n=1 Tax=Streptacidiphilus jiangxiensis TaxID=235985 RepID=A0A1H7JMP6_STRJI|nr:MBL fold metallo-hydrolase [Streptacidiphilus jiangxiensis]SEK75802.1 cyclase [Streptacidiphilus jiangxiensis]